VTGLHWPDAMRARRTDEQWHRRAQFTKEERNRGKQSTRSGSLPRDNTGGGGGVGAASGALGSQHDGHASSASSGGGGCAHEGLGASEM
jgi:hypothetical protein